MAFTASSNSYQFTIAARDGTKAAFNSISTNVTKLSGGIAGLAAKTRAMAGPAALGLAGLGAAGALALGKIYSAAAENIDVLAKQASKIAETTEEVQAFNHAAQLSGVSLEASNKALVVMEKNLGDALDGIGTSADALERLGLNAEQVAALPPVTAYEMLSDELAQVESQTERVYLATQIFGRTGVDMINLTGDAVRSARTEIDELGISLSTVDATQVEAANDAFFKVSEAVQGFGNRLAVEFAPVVVALSNEFLNMAKEAGGFGNIATRVFDAVVKGAAYTANFIRGLEAVWLGVKLVTVGVAEATLNVFETIEYGYRQLANLIPGVEVTTDTVTGNIRQSFTNVREDIQQDLQEALNSPMPYDSVIQWSENVKSQAEEAARAISLAKAGNVDSSEPVAANDPSIDEGGETDEELAAAEIERIQAHQKTILDLTTQHENMILGVKRRAIDTAAAWETATQKQKVQLSLSTFSDLFGAFQGHSKKMFKIGQAASIAQTAINTYDAAVGAYKALAPIPFVGPALGAAAAAAAIGFGMQQVKAIKSQSFGGGASAGAGGVPGQVTSVGTTPITTVASGQAQAANEEKPRPNITINLEPDKSYNGAQLRDMLERLSEEVGYGVKFGT